MKQHTTLSPVALRFILACSMLVLVGLATAGFVYCYEQLKTYAVQVSHKKADDVASSDSLHILQSTQTNLAKNQDAITRAQSITATGVLPQFVAIQDVKTYAARHNLALQTIDFASSADTSTTPATGTTPVPATSVKSVDVSISFSEEINYKDFLSFLNDIEHNIPKMQVAGISLSKGSTINTVKAGPLTIHTYIH